MQPIENVTVLPASGVPSESVSRAVIVAPSEYCTAGAEIVRFVRLSTMKSIVLEVPPAVMITWRRGSDTLVSGGLIAGEKRAETSAPRAGRSPGS